MSRTALCLPLACLVALSCSIAKEPPPEASAARGELRIPAQADVGGVPLADAKIEFSCTVGKGGVLQAAVILPAPEAVAGFPLEAFEGPDGIGETKTLAKWSMPGPGAVDVASAISGWRGVDGDGFLLASSRLSGKRSDLARLLRRWVDDGSRTLSLAVDSPQGGARLEVHATPGDARASIGAALSRCLATERGGKP